MYAFYSSVAASGIEKIACCNCDRELEISLLSGRGMSVSELASELHVSVKTIETHQMRMKEKFALHTAAELRQKAREWLARSAANRIREDPESE
jgi:DNA-binding CsgD family transcriptional regulator